MWQAFSPSDDFPHFGRAKVGTKPKFQGRVGVGPTRKSSLVREHFRLRFLEKPAAFGRETEITCAINASLENSLLTKHLILTLTARPTCMYIYLLY